MPTLTDINRTFGHTGERVLTIALAVVLGACGGKRHEVDPAAFATGWLMEETEHFKLYEPPDSPRAEHLAAFGQACEDAYDQLVGILALKVPQKIVVYRFITNQDCEEATEHTAVHVEGYRIYTRIGAPLGGSIALAACTSIDPKASCFELIRHGLRQAFDSQSANIHREAAAIRAEGRWQPLPDLLSAANVTDHDAYDLQSASFVAYLIQRHGIDKFKMLWRSSLDLESSLEKIYGGSLEQLEEDWIVHLEREAKKT